MDDDSLDKNILDKEDRRAIGKAMSMMTQFGVTGIVCVGGGVLLGHWLDRLLDTTPVFVIIFSIIGIAAAIKTMVDLAKKF